jgi:hypothetical protein
LKLPLRTLLSFFTHPTTREVIPQLAETAALVAEERPEFLSIVLETDPEVLLRSDLLALEESFRGQVAARVLALFDEAKLLDTDWTLRRRYAQLQHSQLAAQLEPYLRDRNRNAVVRRVAMHIAAACHVTGLMGTLVGLAFDPGEPDYMEVTPFTDRRCTRSPSESSGGHGSARTTPRCSISSAE